MKLHKWRDIRAQGSLSPERIAELEKEARDELRAAELGKWSLWWRRLWCRLLGHDWVRQTGHRECSSCGARDLPGSLQMPPWDSPMSARGFALMSLFFDDPVAQVQATAPGSHDGFTVWLNSGNRDLAIEFTPAMARQVAAALIAAADEAGAKNAEAAHP